jgi:hypothetical protein
LALQYQTVKDRQEQKPDYGDIVIGHTERSATDAVGEQAKLYHRRQVPSPCKVWVMGCSLPNLLAVPKRKN